MYQGHSVTGSLRLAPVRPEHGMKWMSFLGLKPTFFRKGTSFSLHSSYLQGRYDNTLVCRTYVQTARTARSVKPQQTCGDVCDHQV